MLSKLIEIECQMDVRDKNKPEERATEDLVTRESMARRLREETRGIQAQKREQILNQRRFSSADEMRLKSYSTSMSSALANLKSVKFNDRKLLERLKAILASGEEGPEGFFTMDGDQNLTSLVNVASGGSSGSTQSQLAAVQVLANLSPLLQKNGIKLARSAGPYLITLLSSPLSALKESSAIALGNLALCGYKVVKVLVNQSVMERLSQTLPLRDTFVNAEVDKHLGASLYAIYHLLDQGNLSRSGRKSNNEPVVEKESIVSILSRCVHLLLVARTKAPLELFWVMFALTCFPETTHNILTNKDSVIHSLLDVCTYEIYQKSDPRPLVKVVTPIVRILANLCSGPNGETGSLLLLRHPDVVAIFTALLGTNYHHLCKETLWLFANIVNSDSVEVHEELIELGLMDKLEYHTVQAVHKVDTYAFRRLR